MTTRSRLDVAGTTGGHGQRISKGVATGIGIGLAAAAAHRHAGAGVGHGIRARLAPAVTTIRREIQGNPVVGDRAVTMAGRTAVVGHADRRRKDRQ